MPVFERPPLETLTPVRERWTPIYLEHGRLEVDDSSVKWIGADCTVFRLPVASLSVLMLGPGTTVTHAAMKACAECNTPVCWVGAEGLHFYATGTAPTHDNDRARRQAELAASPAKRDAVARRMFNLRWFIEPRPNVFVGSVNVRTRAKTLEYIRRNAPGLGMLVIGTERTAQGFSIECFGETPRRPVRLSGLQVLAEAWSDGEEAGGG